MDGKIGLSKERAKISWSKLGLSIIAILLLLTLGVIFLNQYVQKNSDNDRLETIDIGNEIIGALESYYVDNGRYPKSLEQLVPKYLNEIKRPKWGEDGWVYEFADPNYFKITVGYKEWGESYYPVMYYSSFQKKAGWICDN